MNETSPPNVDLQNLRIGRVVSVSGSQLITLMDHTPGGEEESTIRRPDIGEVVNVRTATTVAFGLVTGLSIPIPEHVEDRDAAAKMLGGSGRFRMQHCQNA